MAKRPEDLEKDLLRQVEASLGAAAERLRQGQASGILASDKVTPLLTTLGTLGSTLDTLQSGLTVPVAPPRVVLHKVSQTHGVSAISTGLRATWVYGWVELSNGFRRPLPGNTNITTTGTASSVWITSLGDLVKDKPRIRNNNRWTLATRGIGNALRRFSLQGETARFDLLTGSDRLDPNDDYDFAGMTLFLSRATGNNSSAYRDFARILKLDTASAWSGGAAAAPPRIWESMYGTVSDKGRDTVYGTLAVSSGSATDRAEFTRDSAPRAGLVMMLGGRDNSPTTEGDITFTVRPNTFINQPKAISATINVLS